MEKDNLDLNLGSIRLGRLVLPDTKKYSGCYIRMIVLANGKWGLNSAIRVWH